MAVSVCGSGVLLSTLHYTGQFWQSGLICSDGNSSEFEGFRLAVGGLKKIALEFRKIQFQRRMIAASLLYDSSLLALVGTVLVKSRLIDISRCLARWVERPFGGAII